MVLDRRIVQRILEISCLILQDYFFYSEEALLSFLTTFEKFMAQEMAFLLDNAADEFLIELRCVPQSRKEFTCVFISSNLHTVLVEHLHFSQAEIKMFEDFLPRYGAKADAKKGNQRTHH